MTISGKGQTKYCATVKINRKAGVHSASGDPSRMSGISADGLKSYDNTASVA